MATHIVGMTQCGAGVGISRTPLCHSSGAGATPISSINSTPLWALRSTRQHTMSWNLGPRLPHRQTDVSPPSSLKPCAAKSLPSGPRRVAALLSPWEPPLLHNDPSEAEMTSTLARGRTNTEYADAVLRIMQKFPRGAIILKQVLKRMGLNVGFSQVEYDQIVPVMGLNPAWPFPRYDSPSFVVKRARLPESKFMAICQGVQMVVKEYGSPLYSSNEEATSSFLAPVCRTTTRTRSPSSIQHVCRR
jgi:hypothetical protein